MPWNSKFTQYAGVYNTCVVCSCVDLITFIFISKTSATCIFHYYGTLSKNYKRSNSTQIVEPIQKVQKKSNTQTYRPYIVIRSDQTKQCNWLCGLSSVPPGTSGAKPGHLGVPKTTFSIPGQSVPNRDCPGKTGTVGQLALAQSAII